jgi:membrane protein YdbS with pleckstrin-like domain
MSHSGEDASHWPGASGSWHPEAVDRPLTGAPADQASGAPPQLRPPRNLVSPRAIRYWTARALGGWLVVALAEVFLLVLARDGLLRWQLVALAATVLVAAAHLVVMPRWRFRVHRWEMTANAVYTQSGWFSQERRIAPISRIQTVDTERGPLEQLFGLSNVTITTASAAGPLKIHGLDRDRAQELVDELARAIETTRGDAT